MQLNRRAFNLALAATTLKRAVSAYACSGTGGFVTGQESASGPRQQQSQFFGIDATGKPLDDKTLYRIARQGTSTAASFDVSNQQIACSANALGQVERLALQTGIEPVETGTTPVGAYVRKTLLRFIGMPITVGLDDASPVELSRLNPPVVTLLDLWVPRYEWNLQHGSLLLTIYCPQTAAASPRAVILMWEYLRKSAFPSSTVALTVEAPSPAEKTAGAAALVHGSEKWSGDRDRTLRFEITAERATSVAILLAGSDSEMLQTERLLRLQGPQQWFELSRACAIQRHGALAMPAAPFVAELYVRAGELTRNCLTLTTDGSFGGSFNGSDLPAADNVWLRDCFYSTLPQCWFCPELAAKAILFFLRWSRPSRVLGEHAAKFPGAGSVVNSLGNSVAGIVLAGEYWRWNGNRSFFQSHPEILNRCESILEDVLTSRRDEAYLFPSIYVSDGESRGAYHTGSNIFLWHAFRSFARLALEVYSRPELAAAWMQRAEALRAAILEYCIAESDGKPYFVEGAEQDHTTVSGHDGEESDVTLAAFYGFCEPDDDRYLQTARQALSPNNPYFCRDAEGIWWYAHGKWSAVTFPGWITALAGSTSEDEMLHHLERIRSLTDCDGSFWWWPYPHKSNVDFAQPQRGSSKCGWAAGTYLCYVTRHILGLSYDAPAGTLFFAPFCPVSFSWKSCRLGSLRCDVAYRREANRIVLSVTNRSSQPILVTLEAILPPGVQATLKQPQENGKERLRYGRKTLQLTEPLRPNQSVTLDTAEHA